MPTIHRGSWGQVRGCWGHGSLSGGSSGGRAAAVQGGVLGACDQLPPPLPAAGTLPSNPATLHLLSGIMSSPLRCWHKPAFLLLVTGLSFQFPIVSANGLTRRLPVTFPPPLAALKEGPVPQTSRLGVCWQECGPELGDLHHPLAFRAAISPASSVTTLYGAPSPPLRHGSSSVSF